MKKCISCCLSHQNPATYSFRAVLASKQCLICADFSPDSDQTTDLYFCQKQQFEVKNVLMLDLFLTNTQLLAPQDVNWWTGVVWITCGLLWCFYQLFGLSFWRHPFTAEDPLLSRWWNATFLQICSHLGLRVSTLQISGWTIPLTRLVDTDLIQLKKTLPGKRE